ncbi:hypothetical protein M011DRAFT_503039 [Sporormia fimetaria CBS 119925]|uniref:Uncharacterized protein n=1 Tax=Sporormia fimetaria CBS 119925 TaxID=1340428 RepID=A0A6A6VKB9_9PLEO|nr:hypothetical protein M011DRAFT_503039 [Sporormia fimetaria CBS 119925]
MRCGRHPKAYGYNKAFEKTLKSGKWADNSDFEQRDEHDVDDDEKPTREESVASDSEGIRTGAEIEDEISTATESAVEESGGESTFDPRMVHEYYTQKKAALKWQTANRKQAKNQTQVKKEVDSDKENKTTLTAVTGMKRKENWNPNPNKDKKDKRGNGGNGGNGSNIVV